MMKLISTKRRMINMRQVNPGDVFEIDPRFGKILISIGHAREADSASQVSRPGRKAQSTYATRELKAEVDPQAEAAKAKEAEGLSSLTDQELKQIAELEGLTVDGRWSRATLIDRIATGRYERRDMRATS